MISRTTQRLLLESGRVSSIRTMSPGLHSLFSSCAMNLLVRVIRLW